MHQRILKEYISVAIVKRPRQIPGSTQSKCNERTAFLITVAVIASYRKRSVSPRIAKDPYRLVSQKIRIASYRKRSVSPRIAKDPYRLVSQKIRIASYRKRSVSPRIAKDPYRLVSQKIRIASFRFAKDHKPPKREFAIGENTEDSQSVYEDVGITLPNLDETQIAQSENEFRDVSLYLKTNNGRVQGAEHPPFELPNRWTYATLKAIVEDYVEGMTGAPVVVDQLYYKKARGKSVVLLNNDGDLTALLKEYPLLHKCGKKKMKSTMYLAVDYHNQSNKEEEHHTPVTPRRSPRIANSCFDIFVYEMANDMKVCHVQDQEADFVNITEERDENEPFEQDQDADFVNITEERDENDPFQQVIIVQHCIVVTDPGDDRGGRIGRNPFSCDPTLRSIATGVVADNAVNVDKSKEVGNKILSSMVGKNAYEYSFKKKDQAVTLGSKTAVRINDDTVQVDPQLLFQRLSVIATGGRYEDPRSLFRYEMCSFPSSLFDSSGLPRQANKPALADAIWGLVKNDEARITGNVKFVLDGGALLHRLPWPRGLTYDDICTLYVEYVTRRYGKATIVFDGYEDGPSIKDATHQRRTGPCPGPAVNFASDMVVKSKKDEFLANQGNKQKFINILSGRFEMAGCPTNHASGDADLLIVQTAINSARSCTTVLVGDDTDLLVLLLFHADMTKNDIFFNPEPKQHTKIS
ncbi:hypothetical protein QZH41_004828 [Actinostola sp. cb2023]|nr:hypothetical protein QZH41_004828 [Actinostola sp. cb2023]